MRLQRQAVWNWLKELEQTKYRFENTPSPIGSGLGPAVGSSLSNEIILVCSWITLRLSIFLFGSVLDWVQHTDVPKLQIQFSWTAKINTMETGSCLQKKSTCQVYFNCREQWFYMFSTMTVR